MKKLLLSSLVLLMFSAAMLLFQVSCKKEVTAQTPTTSTGLQQLNKVLFSKYIGTNVSDELWSANYDGTGREKISLVMPSTATTTKFYIDNAWYSPDGKKLFINIHTIPANTYQYSTYSFNADGTNGFKLFDGGDEYAKKDNMLGAF